MSNCQSAGSKLFLGSFPAALIGVLVVLSGCEQGSGGGGADGSASLQNPEAALLFVRDTQPPSIPTGLSAKAVSSAQIELAWSPSTDNTGVTHYRVRRNGALVATVGKVTTYEDIKLAASTTYSYTVRAVDAAGNVSGLSNVASATTQATDTTPPTVSSTSPANAALDIAVNSAITATFSEVMLTSTLNASTFQLTTQGGLPVAGTVSATGNSMTFKPSVPLDALAQYTATVTTGVQDSAGNPLAGTFTWNFTTSPVPDTTPPTVSAISPADAASGVALNTAVSATFSEAMTNATLTNTTFILTQTSGGAVIGSRVSISGNTATLVPSVALSGDTNYTATITTGVQDAAGNSLAANLVWTFTTAAAPDTTPPTVSGMSPASGATGVALNTAVSATFSEPMTNSTLTNASFTLAGSGGAAVAGMVTVNGNTATFTPTAPLAAMTLHTATISTAAKDAAGNALAANFSSTFTTAAVLDTTPPTVSATSPGNAATGVALNSPVSATFSEAMTNATLNTASFTLTTSGGAPVAGMVNVSGNTATFAPSAPLAASTLYTAAITTAASDAAGNALAAGFTWFFTTGPGAPPVPTVSLAANPTSVASGGSSTLTWSSADAASCSASGAWSGAKATSGSETTAALTSPGTFALACTGAGGTASTSATVTVSGVASTPSYTTNFDLTENPISEGGAWRRASNAWTNVRTGNGIAFGTNGSLDTYDDSYALLSGFGPDQQAQAVVFRSPTLVSSGITHEMELLLRFSDDAGNARGYECLFNYAGGVDIVRWNGPLGNFTPLALTGGAGSLGRDLVSGDVIKATIVGNVISTYINGVLMVQASDSTYASGQPGIAFFTRPDGVSASALFGMTSYTASASGAVDPAPPPPPPPPPPTSGTSLPEDCVATAVNGSSGCLNLVPELTDSGGGVWTLVGTKVLRNGVDLNVAKFYSDVNMLVMSANNVVRAISPAHGYICDPTGVVGAWTTSGC
jgi:hypothetical protein